MPIKKSEAKSKIEIIKEKSRGLRGSIARELKGSEDNFSADNVQVLKFHGIYQQDDRDQRKPRRQEGLGKAYQFMVRIRNPGGGKLTASQWLVLDKVASLYGNGSLRITTRQGIQFHGVGKTNLQSSIRLLDSELVSTYGACGDGNRNTMACPVSAIRKGSQFDGQVWARRIAETLTFESTAYFDIWLDGEKLLRREKESLYGDAYLPRKFKIAIADPDHNCVDVLSNDIGIVPRLEAEVLAGFHIHVGGGMGSTHRKRETFPRLADPLAFVGPEQLIEVVRGVVAAQRDLGDRANRRKARLKYLVERIGIAAFRKEVQDRVGFSLPRSRPLEIRHHQFHHGAQPQEEEDRYYLGLFVENGRIQDGAESRLLSAIRQIASRISPDFLLTPNQDLVMAGLFRADLELVHNILEEHGSRQEATSPPALRSAAMACPALPTCGLAITEAERRLPGVIRQLEESGYGDERIGIRMSGCPNACSRPPLAEIGLMGRSVNGYSLYLGGNREGTRLATLYAEDVSAEDLFREISLLIDVFRDRRLSREAFGDFCHRVGNDHLRNLVKEAGQTKELVR